MRFSNQGILYYYNDDSELAYVGRWICNAIDRGVSELDVSINPRYDPYVPGKPFSEYTKSHGEAYLPFELFKCKTLVTLSLGRRFSLAKLPQDLYLPSLKILLIDSIWFSNEDELCKVLLAGCPVLEELYVVHVEHQGHPYRISSQSIKKLTVHYDCDMETFLFMGFDAPNLAFLDYTDYALSGYAPVNLASLVEARLDLHPCEDVERPDVTGLIVGISNVQTLHLTPDSAHVISRCVKDGLVIPMFNNLVKLSFGSKNKRGWRLLPHLLKQSPKLETLIVQGLDGYRGDVSLSPYKVKVLHIFNYGGTAKELKDLKSFIGETECLKLVQVEIEESIVVDDIIIEQTYSDLTTLVGVSASPKCEVEVDYHIKSYINCSLENP